MLSMPPVLSLVSGTYNRLPQLEAMVASFRRTLPPDWQPWRDYEIVLVDGGSTDGTLTWSAAQPDVRLIAHGALLGAIRAFTDGARAAAGAYVLLANDDVIFHPDSILPAIAHLETHPGCGGVAYADDRPAPGKPPGHAVQRTAYQRDGVIVSAPFAQVGMFPKALGDWAGWWGADDPNFRARTYGGDNYLTARLYEAGYTIDAVPGCVVDDHVHADALRARNTARDQRASGFAARYPMPPVWGRLSDAPVVSRDRWLRIMYAPIYDPSAPHARQTKRGLRQALAARGIVWEVDYLQLGGTAVVEAVKRWQPHLIVLQVHSAEVLTAAHVDAMRRAAPHTVIVNWYGDVYDHIFAQPDMLALMRAVDWQLVVNAAHLALGRQRGIRTAYWQVAWEPVDEAWLPSVPAYDVIFLGNAYNPARLALGQLLRQQTGIRIGLYGAGWPDADGETNYDFARGRALYRAAALAISDNPWPNSVGYVSNRLFEALIAGVCVLQQHIPGAAHWLGLRPGVHFIEWHTLDELPDLIAHWLSPAQATARAKIAAAGRRAAQRKHHFAARVDALADILEAAHRDGDHLA